MFHTIMVAYDESREAAHALASAIELATSLGAHLKIVTVVEALPSFYNIAAMVSPSVLSESLEDKRSRLRTLSTKRYKESDIGWH
jgi:nucleotide-binding universal stress UspA family protein